MKKTLLMIAAAALVGCGNPKHNDQPEQNAVAESQAGDEMTHEAGTMKVQLDNGKRWQANPETTQGIEDMQVLLGTLPSEPSEADYQNLRTGLEEKLNFIFNECTMQGAAHDQLHNYLIPLKDLIAQCGSGTPEENKAVAQNLITHLNEYANYFE